MKITDSIKNFFSSTKSALGGSWKSIAGGSYNTKGVVRAYSDWVYIATNKIAETVAGIDFFIVDKNGEKVAKHPLYEYLDDGDFIETISSSLEVFGNAYLLLDSPTNPKDIRVLEPQKVTIEKKGWNIISYGYNGKKIAPDMVAHFKVPNMLDPTTGRSTVDHILDWISNSKSGQDLKNAFYRNGGTLSNIFETDYETEDELNTLAIAFDNVHKGAGNANKALFLPAGVKHKDPSKLADIHNSEEAQADRDRILSAFGVPKSILGITESGASKADGESKNDAFWQFTITPRAVRLSRQIKKELLSLFSRSEGLSIGYTDPTPRNLVQEIKQIESGLGGRAYMTVNEARAMRGLAPASNADEIPAGPSMSEEEDEPMIPEEEKSFEKKETLEEGIEKLTKQFKEKKKPETWETLGETGMEKKHKALSDRLEPSIGSMTRDILKQQGEMKERILKGLSKQLSNKETVEGLFAVDIRQESDELTGVTFNLAQDIAVAEGTRAMAEISANAFEMKPDMTEDLKKFVGKNADSYTETTIKLLEKEMREGIELGESLVKLTARVDDVFALGGDYRAKTIAQNIVFGTANDGIRDAYVQSGVVKTIKWYTAGDERVCLECGAMHGSEVGADELFFDIGDTITRSDGTTRINEWNPIWGAYMHSRCRCFTVVSSFK